jgi:hypothetical protein
VGVVKVNENNELERTEKKSSDAQVNYFSLADCIVHSFSPLKSLIRHPRISTPSGQSADASDPLGATPADNGQALKVT